MSVICELVGNVVASYWDGVIAAEDGQTVVSVTGSGYERTRESLVAMAIMAPTVKRPTLEFGKFIYAHHPQMREMYRSIHIAILAKGFVATSLKSFVTLSLMDGTGGKLSVHDTVEQAWAAAEAFGRMTVPLETVRTRLRAKGAQF